MLERAKLRIFPWTDKTPVEGVAIRPIQDADTDEPLGYARLMTSGTSHWLSWLHSDRIEILETEDASLLCVLYRPWPFMQIWEILDAEEQRIGSVDPPSLLDAQGYRRAFIRNESKTHLAWAGLRGERYAELELGDVWHFRFADDLEPNPFWKMLLLASVLSLQPRGS